MGKKRRSCLSMLSVAAAGVGLWRLEEWGRRLAIAMQAIGLVQYVVYMSSLMTRYSEEMTGS